MAFTRSTRLLDFYKNGRSNRMSNPMRRWVYHYTFFGLLSCAGVYLGCRYLQAGWEATRRPEAGDCLCSSEMVDALNYLPFNFVSNVMGHLAENTSLPQWVHQAAVNSAIRWCKVDMSESLRSDNFDTFQQFYTRDWAPAARPVDAAAAVVAPCDGTLLAVHSDVQGSTLVQVKGLSYGIRALLQETPPPVDAARCTRVAAVIHMRNKDFHHVIAPVPFRCIKSVYVPGSVLPATAAGYHWIPSVLCMNERLVVCGTSVDKQELPVYMALVGSTLTGRIRFYLDQRVRTNFLEPPEYALHNAYASRPALTKGERVATFNWGSSVVLLVDVPKGCVALKHAGEVVKAGEALFK